MGAYAIAAVLLGTAFVLLSGPISRALVATNARARYAPLIAPGPLAIRIIVIGVGCVAILVGMSDLL